MVVLSELADSIEFKVRKLIMERETLVKDLNRMKEENMQQLHLINELKTALMQSEERIQGYQSMMRKNSEGVNVEITGMIDEIVREIDKCITEINR